MIENFIKNLFANWDIGIRPYVLGIDLFKQGILKVNIFSWTILLCLLTLEIGEAITDVYGVVKILPNVFFIGWEWYSIGICWTI